MATVGAVHIILIIFKQRPYLSLIIYAYINLYGHETPLTGKQMPRKNSGKTAPKKENGEKREERKDLEGGERAVSPGKKKGDAPVCLSHHIFVCLTHTLAMRRNRRLSLCHTILSTLICQTFAGISMCVHVLAEFSLFLMRTIS